MPVAAPPELSYKTAPFRPLQVKASGQGWTVTGYASTFSGPNAPSSEADSYGDLVMAGCFSRSIRERPTKLMLEHRVLIGHQLELKEDARGLLGTWAIAPTTDGSDAHTLLLSGALDQMSIGYIAVDTETRSDGCRLIREATLYECSLVGIAANPNAVVVDAKSGGSTMSVAQRMAARGLAPVSPLARSIAQRLTSSAEYKRLVEGSEFHSEHSQIRLKLDLPGVSIIRELKALTTSLANPADVRAEQMLLTPPEFGLIDVLPTFPTDQNVVEIVTSTVTNNAATVAEASATTGVTGLKPESTITYTGVMVPPQVVSHWLPVTRQVLADAPALEGSINTELLWGLRAKLEDQAINGDGNSPNLRGILAWTGVLTQSAAGLRAVDALTLAMVAVRSTSRRMPTIIAVNTTSWGALLLARQNVTSGTLGGLQLGDPDGGAPSIWGVPIVPSDALPAGTALVGAAATAALYEREEGVIRIGTQGTQFVRNMATMLAETRVAVGVSRPQAWCIVSGLPS